MVTNVTGDALSNIGSGLLSIAGGLSAMGLAGLLAFPILDKLAEAGPKITATVAPAEEMPVATTGGTTGLGGVSTAL